MGEKDKSKLEELHEIGQRTSKENDENSKEYFKLAVTLNSTAIIASFALLKDLIHVNGIKIIHYAQLDWYRGLICALSAFILYYFMSREAWRSSAFQFMTKNYPHIEAEAVRKILGPADIYDKYYLRTSIEYICLVFQVMSLVFFFLGIKAIVETY